MIRVNLLAVDRERTKRKSKFQLAQKLTLACSLILVAAALSIGWWWWLLESQSARLDADLAAAQQETARLHTLIQQVDQFEQRKAQLQQRVSLIEQLRKGQSGPVHMLDQISRSLPDTLWLTQLKQQGTDLTVDGRCMTLTALSDFVGNLSASGYFKKGIEILNSEVEAPQQGATAELIKFSVKAQFELPGQPAAVTR